MSHVLILRPGDVHFSAQGGFLGGGSMVEAIKRRKRLEECVAQFSREHPDRPISLDTGFTLHEGAFVITVISNQDRDADINHFFGWLLQRYPEVAGDWSIRDPTSGEDSVAVGSGDDALMDFSRTSQYRPPGDHPPDGGMQASGTDLTDVGVVVRVIEEGRDAFPAEEGGAGGRLADARCDCPDDQDNPNQPPGPQIPPCEEHPKDDDGRVMPPGESGAATAAGAAQAAERADVLGEPDNPGSVEPLLPEPLVLTSRENDAKRTIEVLVESSSSGVLYAGNGERLVVLVKDEEERELLLEDPSLGTFEAVGQAIVVRTIDVADG